MNSQITARGKSIQTSSTVVFLTFAGYTAILQEHCNHNVVNIVFWLASVMIVSIQANKITCYGLQNANCNWF